MQAGDNVGLLMRGLKRDDVERGQVKRLRLFLVMFYSLNAFWIAKGRSLLLSWVWKFLACLTLLTEVCMT